MIAVDGYATHRHSGAPWTEDVMVLVTFSEAPGAKLYSYWASGLWNLRVGDKVSVIAIDREKIVTVQRVLPVKPGVRLKRAYRSLQAEKTERRRTASSRPQNSKQATAKETDMIKIETKTFVDNLDVEHLTDDELFDKLRRAETELRSLEAIENKPQRLVSRITQLDASLKGLVRLLDERDAKQTPAKSGGAADE